MFILKIRHIDFSDDQPSSDQKDNYLLFDFHPTFGDITDYIMVPPMLNRDDEVPLEEYFEITYEQDKQFTLYAESIELISQFIS